MLKRFIVASLFAVLTLSFGSTNTNAAEPKDIVDTAVAGKFNTLVAAVKAAELVETLKGKGPFTVFAPTDEAFAKLGDATIKKVLADKELLKKILLAHVVVGKDVYAKDVVGLDGKEVNGFKISTKDGVKIGDAKVTKTDIKCANGVIHVIDTVLIPK
ncbi:MAG: fasciclin domain-containing protein [Zavarzinella sp.]